MTGNSTSSRSAFPKKHYYVISPLGRRLVDLGLGKVALSWVGVSGVEERQLVERVMEQYPNSWRTEWLRLKGLPEWAEYLNQLQLEFSESEEYQCV